jgi:hypothetical protein
MLPLVQPASGECTIQPKKHSESLDRATKRITCLRPRYKKQDAFFTSSHQVVMSPDRFCWVGSFTLPFLSVLHNEGREKFYPFYLITSLCIYLPSIRLQLSIKMLALVYLPQELLTRPRSYSESWGPRAYARTNKAIHQAFARPLYYSVGWWSPVMPSAMPLLPLMIVPDETKGKHVVVSDPDPSRVTKIRAQS